MTYIDLANQFWRAHEEYSFSSSTIALYFYLLNVCNRRKWRMPFSGKTSIISEELQISKSTFSEARKQLEEAGLISYSDGKSRFVPAQYTLLEWQDNKTVEQTVKCTDDMTHIYKYKEKRNLEREMSIPMVADVETYMAACVIPGGYELKVGLPQRFHDYYSSKDWMIGNSQMTDWRATARKWTNDTQNLIKKENGTSRQNTEGWRVDGKSQARGYAEELIQQTIDGINRE